MAIILWLYYYYYCRIRRSSYYIVHKHISKIVNVFYYVVCVVCAVCSVGYYWYVRASTRDWHRPRICGIQTGISFVGTTILDGGYILYYIIFYFIINIIIINIDSSAHAALSESLVIFIFSSTLRSHISTPVYMSHRCES
jgi:hypothetical protein